MILPNEGFAACHYTYRWHYDSQEHGNVINITGNNKKEQPNMYKAIYSSGGIIYLNVEFKDQMVLTESLVWIFS